MKVFALGGYGTVGLPAIKLLAQSDLVTEIAIVGRSLERAGKAAKEIWEKAIVVHADGVNEQKLTSLLEGYDIIMNAAKREVVLPALRAAIRTGTHYCDVAHGEAIEQALQHSAEAEAAGITSIVGNGIAPGLINLMGVHVASQLEEIQQLQNGRAGIFWLGGPYLTPQQWLMDSKESLNAIRVFKPFFLMMLKRLQKEGSRTVCDYHDGRWVQKDPIKYGLDVPLIRGGITTLYPYASGDPLWGSLPSDLSRVPPVEVWLSLLPPQLHEVLREQALQVLEGNIDSETAVDFFYETIESDPHRMLILPDDFVAFPKEWACAVGRKKGRAARYNCWFTAPMWKVGGWFLTSAALAVAVRKILGDEIRERGVMTAEKAFEPLPFFDEVASLIPNFPSDGKLVDESFEWLE